MQLLRKHLVPGQCFVYPNRYTSERPAQSNTPVVVTKNFNIPSGLPRADRDCCWYISCISSEADLESFGNEEVRLIHHYKEPKLTRADLYHGDCFVYADDLDNPRLVLEDDSGPGFEVIKMPPDFTDGLGRRWNYSNHTALEETYQTYAFIAAARIPNPHYKAEKPVIRIPRWDQNELIIPDGVPFITGEELRVKSTVKKTKTWGDSILDAIRKDPTLANMCNDHWKTPDPDLDIFSRKIKEHQKKASDRAKPGIDKLAATLNGHLHASPPYFEPSLLEKLGYTRHYAMSYNKIASNLIAVQPMSIPTGAIFNFDAERELTQVLADQIAAEVDRGLAQGCDRLLDNYDDEIEYKMYCKALQSETQLRQSMADCEIADAEKVWVAKLREKVKKSDEESKERDRLQVVCDIDWD